LEDLYSSCASLIDFLADKAPQEYLPQPAAPTETVSTRASEPAETNRNGFLMHPLRIVSFLRLDGDEGPALKTSVLKWIRVRLTRQIRGVGGEAEKIAGARTGSV
jgi:hypothetical protein